jgi:hypothetical protein
MRKHFATFTWLFVGCLIASAALSAQTDPTPGPTPDTAPGPTSASGLFQRTEGTDSTYGIHWVRMAVSLPRVGDQERAPRFTVECQDLNGRHDMIWFVSFGGFDDPGFLAPWEAGRNKLWAVQYPPVDLKMTFEGYSKPKTFTRSWAVQPGGDFRYRNAGTDSPNMDSVRFFVAFLNALPGVRIVHAKRMPGDPGELFFPASPIVQEMNKTPICSP